MNCRLCYIWPGQTVAETYCIKLALPVNQSLARKEDRHSIHRLYGYFPQNALVLFTTSNEFKPLWLQWLEIVNKPIQPGLAEDGTISSTSSTRLGLGYYYWIKKTYANNNYPYNNLDNTVDAVVQISCLSVSVLWLPTIPLTAYSTPGCLFFVCLVACVC